MPAYYNEIDPFAAEWLRQLIKAGHIADGEVDERSIEDVLPSELTGFTQCHFFAGIGVWSYALRQAGWVDERPVWTGSCPCQPFSAAGKGKGADDKRHLWPHFHHLISQCRPDVVFGEQVSSKDGLAWFDLVQADLEGEGYAAGALDTCAASIGAPHIRQRLFWVADTNSDRQQAWSRDTGQQGQAQPQTGRDFERCSSDGGVADTLSQRPQGRLRGRQDQEREAVDRHTGRGSATGRMADTTGEPGEQGTRSVSGEEAAKHSAWKQDGGEHHGPPDDGENRYYRGQGSAFVRCADGKARPIEPGVQPLAYGTANRVGLIRGYGNAIQAQVAQTFIEAYLDTKEHY